MDTTAKFLQEIEAHLKRRGINATQFGKDAVKDPAFVLKLRRGRSPSGRTMDKVRAHIRQSRMTQAAE